MSKETTVDEQSLETQVDGRVARSERTREAIAEALLELLEEGVQPDVLVLRTEYDIDISIRKKVALFCNACSRNTVIDC